MRASSFTSTRFPPARRKSASKALEASDLQPVRRDFAFLLDREIAAGEVVRARLRADRALISDVGVFDVFTGQGVPEGKKSLAIEVTLQPREKTLTDAEIEAVAEKVVAAVNKATGGDVARLGGRGRTRKDTSQLGTGWHRRAKPTGSTGCAAALCV